jgi:hypothetical protein
MVNNNLEKVFIAAYKTAMSHTRRSDQSVDAFSLPVDLLAQAKARAAAMKMTKSGFYRYCLARTLGYSEDEARKFSVHRAVLNSVETALRLTEVSSSNGSDHANYLAAKAKPVSYRKRASKKSATQKHPAQSSNENP